MPSALWNLLEIFNHFRLTTFASKTFQRRLHVGWISMRLKLKSIKLEVKCFDAFWRTCTVHLLLVLYVARNFISLEVEIFFIYSENVLILVFLLGSQVEKKLLFPSYEIIGVAVWNYLSWWVQLFGNGRTNICVNAYKKNQIFGKEFGA